MTASPNIKTPAMEVPLYRSAQAQARGEELKKHFTRVSLDQVSLDQVSLDQVNRSASVRSASIPIITHNGIKAYTVSLVEILT